MKMCELIKCFVSDINKKLSVLSDGKQIYYAICTASMQVLKPDQNLVQRIGTNGKRVNTTFHPNIFHQNLMYF